MFITPYLITSPKWTKQRKGQDLATGRWPGVCTLRRNLH
jgi:hypothetical protein